MTFDERLKSLRTTAGKTQAYMTEALEICLPYYRGLEQGKKTPSEGMVKRIADFFKVPVSSFNCTAITDQQSEEITTEITPILSAPIPTAVKKIYLRTSDGYVCTEEYCGWRRQDGDTYFCLVPGNGCMKERSGEIAKQTGSDFG